MRPYWLRVLISIDQLGNTLVGGDPDETISSTLGKIKAIHGGRIPWRYPLARILDRALEAVDRGHSTKSVDPTEGAEDPRDFADQWADLYKIPPPLRSKFEQKDNDVT